MTLIEADFILLPTFSFFLCSEHNLLGRVLCHCCDSWSDVASFVNAAYQMRPKAALEKAKDKYEVRRKSSNLRKGTNLNHRKNLAMAMALILNCDTLCI